MAYEFAGFFAQPPVSRPDTLPNGAVWRDIAIPFRGVGIRLPRLIGQTPAPADVQALARQLGLHVTNRWLYLTYTCWGGRIDFVYGLGVRDGVSFGPVEEPDDDKLMAAFVGLMEQFGVAARAAERFEPFKRGYWGVA